MTNLGTYWEGLIVIILAIIAAVLSSLLNIPWLMTVAAALFALGLAYMSGGSAGKTEAIRKLTASGLPRDAYYLKKIVRS